jgi:hypothetical protein
MSRQHFVCIALVVIACLLPSALQVHAAEITNFFGGDAEEGLDLEGNIVYAVNMRGEGGHVVRGVEFTEDLDTDGFILEATHEVLAWATPDYGDSEDDDELEIIMESIRWSLAPDVVNIEMDVQSGQSYKLQMLFTESCCDRSFDIVFEDELLFDDFTIYEHHVDDIWSLPSRNDGVLITHEFTAGDAIASLQLGTGAPDFPDNNGHISAITLELLGAGTAGDFDGNGTLEAADIDALSAAVRTGSQDTQYDLNNDNEINNADRAVWVDTLKRTWFGDSNLDGEFNSSDFVQVFQRGEYEDASNGNSTWEEGDWDGDGDFSSSDFVIAFQSGGFEIGPRPAVAAVPEPANATLLLLGMIFSSRCIRKTRVPLRGK